MNGPLTSTLLADREVLYIFRAVGCPACEAAIPEVYRFMESHPAATVLILDAGGPYPAQLGIKIKATPTYVFRRGDQGESFTGVMKASEIERWIKRNGGAL